MTPRERFLTTLRGERADRVPLVLEGFHRVDAANEPDPEKRKIAERIIPETHYCWECPTYLNRYLVTPPQRMRQVGRGENGGTVTTTVEIDTPKGPLTAVTATNRASNTVWTLKYPVESLDEIEAIRSVPWELPPLLAPPDLSRLPPGFSERGVLRAGVSSPFVCVAGMMPYALFLELCATELPLIRELSAICLERTLSVLDTVLAERSVEYVWIGGCEWITPPMAGGATYRVLAHDFERPIIERIHAGGALAHVHCHGNVRSTLGMVIERGADFFEPVEPPPDGDIPFAEAKALAAGRITLGGNIEARVLENEDAAAVEAAVYAAFEGGRKRMVLQSSAGPIGPLSPRALANYHRMVDLWEDLSPM